MRTATAVCLLTCLLALHGGLPPVAAQPDDQPEQEAAATETIPLSDTLRFIIQPTILGLVPPRGPQGYGEVFVRIVEARRNRIAVHYEIKEEVPLPPDAEPSHRPGADKQTRIRRGEIAATGIRRSPAILPPLYWGDGALATDSALLWLSGVSFKALADQGSCPLDLLNCGPVDSPAADELRVAAGELISAAQLAEDAKFTLDKLEPALYPCVVNGKRARLAAMHAADSLGLAEYWILDDPDNPLVLKLTYMLGDAGQQGELSFVQKGGGYAITSIDFSPQRKPGP